METHSCGFLPLNSSPFLALEECGRPGRIDCTGVDVGIHCRQRSGVSEDSLDIDAVQVLLGGEPLTEDRENADSV